MKLSLNGPQTHHELDVSLLPLRLDRDVSRVLTLPFDMSSTRQVSALFRRVDALEEAEVKELLEHVFEWFSNRHDDLEAQLRRNYSGAIRLGQQCPLEWSKERAMLLGSYFSMEYSIEAAALFNPSIVSHPDQADVREGALRFVMSLRAVGEGHISSTVFQTGEISADGQFRLDRPGRFSARTKVRPDHLYDKPLFSRKLREIGIHTDEARPVLDQLPDEFTFDALMEAVDAVQGVDAAGSARGIAHTITWLARANYELRLDPHDAIGDLILYPRSVSESRGIEDMRLVRFEEEDGTTRYFGTYTAYDGHHILPMLMETKDFREIAVHTLNGACAQNKGMALFPKRINGHYAMCSRIDGQKLYLMFSDNVHFWESAALLAEPKYPWEFRVMGNCGSPIETDAGWLLMTHGVGPLRRYCIGAMLLDRLDPSRVLGRLSTPLIEPAGKEREGYVPNVVYSCGSLIHADRLYLPFAVSDTATRIATVPVRALLDRILKDGP